jgi:hypothetical protein
VGNSSDEQRLDNKQDDAERKPKSEKEKRENALHGLTLYSPTATLASLRLGNRALKPNR